MISSEDLRFFDVLTLRYLSMPSASPAAPSNVISTNAMALRKKTRSRRSGMEIRDAERPKPKVRPQNATIYATLPALIPTAE